MKAIEERDDFGVDEGEEFMPESMHRYLVEVTAVQRLMRKLAKVIEASPDGRQLSTTQPLISVLKNESRSLANQRSGLAAYWEFGDRLAVPGDVPPAPCVYATTKVVHVRQFEESVPYGVIRVFASNRAGIPLASVCRIMEFAEGSPGEWRLEIPKMEFFVRVPTDPVEYSAIPASPDSFACFSSSKIEELLKKSSPLSARVRQSVEDLIRDLKEWEHV